MAEETYYTISEAASILGEDQKRLERMVSRGIIKTIDLHGDKQSVPQSYQSINMALIFPDQYVAPANWYAILEEPRKSNQHRGNTVKRGCTCPKIK